jgi:hypothetical protein
MFSLSETWTSVGRHLRYVEAYRRSGTSFLIVPTGPAYGGFGIGSDNRIVEPNENNVYYR